MCALQAGWTVTAVGGTKFEDVDLEELEWAGEFAWNKRGLGSSTVVGQRLKRELQGLLVGDVPRPCTVQACSSLGTHQTIVGSTQGG